MYKLQEIIFQNGYSYNPTDFTNFCELSCFLIAIRTILIKPCQGFPLSWTLKAHR